MRVAIQVAQQPEKHVEHNHRARIADMCEIIDGRTTDIDSNICRIERSKFVPASRQRVVKAQFHARVITRQRALRNAFVIG